MIYLTSDLHLGHKNILKFVKRPFSDVEEMNEALIKNINSVIKRNSDLYILGDLYFGPNQEVNTFEYAKKIKCDHIHLIRGNHDMHLSELIKLNEEYKVFETIAAYKELNYEKKRIVLCHFPFMDNAWNKAMHGSIDLHGHLHSNKDYNLEQRSNRLLRYDVGVDANNYHPVLLDDILDFFKDIKPNEYDYHANSGDID